LGRWFVSDKLKHIYPSTSPYCYALNTPIGAKDADGRYTIFVNGYIYGDVPGSSDDLEPGYEYWRGSKFKYVNGKKFIEQKKKEIRLLTRRIII
jgi:hypothetical protein